MNSQPISIEKRFLETANAFHGNSHPFHPFPKAVDRKAYEGLPAALKELLIQAGEAKLGYEFPVIRATDYMRFKRDGDRAAFEALYFAKRNALNDLIQAECVEHQGRFLDDILNGIYSICEETAWQLPAHNSYIRDTPQLILPDVTRPVMDLFACETGALLACAAYLLEDDLNAVSPFILTCIEDNLKRRILLPYLTAHFWWMGHDDEPMCNWTVWCTQNVLLTTFLMPWSVEMSSRLSSPVRTFCGNAPLFLPENTSDTVVTLQAILHKAAESCDYFLKDYGNDGTRLVEFQYEGLFMERLEELGSMPLPPYIERSSQEEDKERYQTVYCEEEGSVAAPTAGLHFTDELLEQAKKKGVELVYVTLHVGIGTFRPVKCENI